MKKLDESINSRRCVARVYSRSEAIRVCDPNSKEYDFLSSTQARRDRDWDMNLGYDGAYAALVNGLDLPREFRGALTLPDYQMDTAPRHQVRISEEGDEFLADRYFDRQEEYYLDLVPQVSEGMSPVIDIIVGLSASASVPASHIFTRAGAIYRLIQGLEASGFTARVVASNTVSVRAGGYWHVAVVAKDSEEMASPKQLAAFFHPAFFRRILFRLYETEPDPIREFNNSSTGGYGYPAHGPARGDLEAVLDRVYSANRRFYFGSPSDYSSLYSTPESAMEHILNVYNQELTRNREIQARAA